MSAETVPGMVLERVAANGPRAVLREKQRGIWKSVSWADLGARMRGVAAALRAGGFAPGDVACVLAETRPEWVYADLGILAAGGVSAGIYPTSGPELVADILRDCGARILFVENEEQLDKALQARATCPALRRIVIFDMKGLRDLDDPMCESLVAFLARGEGQEAPFHEADPGDLAVLIYTAGTTGAPKGAMLSHRNILSQVEHAARLLGQHAGDERLSFMPMCHVMERVLGLYLALYTGTVSNYAESPDSVQENLREVRPTVLKAPPHVWERFHARVQLANGAATFVQRMLFRAAIGAGLRAADRRLAGRRRSGIGALLLRRLVLGNVRRELGLDRLRIGLIGAAPSSAELIRWFMALGIDLIEIYGQTECAGLAAAMPADAPRLNAVGRPVPYGEVAIAADGEVLLRGPHVFMGYWNRPEETARVLRDGWLRTGDLGRLVDGYLQITGRRHDVLRTATGQEVPAAEIEKELKISPYIADAVLFGDGRAFLSCLVMIDHDAVEAWANAHNVAFTNFRTLVRADEVRRLIGAEIERALARLGQPGRIGSYRLIEQKLEPEDAELTPVMRLRRGVVGEKYRTLIEEMYVEA
ncbi:MAG TPA: long-chain fatty acid--CoA ligase [Acetobacteraceae bacterium]|nr:long-chain fatty acid--CoA ligase [Acetobacteraceae bacterium]